jgi:hypothetical protein
MVTWLLVALSIHSESDGYAGEPRWQAGFAKVVITPDEPMWLTGYGGRSRPAEGKVHDLYARAAALKDAGGHRVVFISMDLIGVPAEMARVVSGAAAQKHGLDRADIMFCSSHTHCGPALDQKLSHMLAMEEADWKQVRTYQQQLNAKLKDLVDLSLADLQPARLSAGRGICRFAANRRQPRGLGPYDHDVPVLHITAEDGTTLRGVIFGYACHSTTLSFYKWCGDYPGFASLYLEERHPGATALFFAGCGADQNPLPRRKLELARKYGRMLALAVENVLSSKTHPVPARVQTEIEWIEIEFDRMPTRAELEAQLSSESRYVRSRAALLLDEINVNGSLATTYPYPVQVWELGDGLTWAALGGEVVVDYALRLKRELGESQTWVAAYANDVMAYIPSERVLKEGGYEGDSSMVPYQQPSRWKPGLEDKIVDAVRRLSSGLKSGSNAVDSSDAKR